MTPGPKHILFGLVVATGVLGALVVLNMVLGDQLFLYVCTAVAFCMLVYLIATLYASAQSRKRE